MRHGDSRPGSQPPPDLEDKLPLQELTCEVRWICRGDHGAGLAAWFSQFTPVPETREDAYLVAQRIPGLSVKIRGGTSLDVKQHRGVVGSLDTPGGAAGVDSWAKLSLPVAHVTEASLPREAWRRVSKRRQIASFPVGVTPGDAGSGRAVCAVELTDVEACGQRWWTLALEAHGDGALEALESTAAMVLAKPLPGAGPLTPLEARSYGDWLRELACPGSPASAT